MELEAPVASGEPTQNLSPEPAQELPEVAAPDNAEPEAQADAEQPEADDREKALKRMERRIQRLTAARYEAEARAKAAAEEAARFREQFQQPEAQPEVDPIKLADVIARVRETNAKANQIAKVGSEKFQNFGEAVRTLNEEAGPLFNQHGLPTALGEAVFESDDPAALLHHLGTNPEVAAELHGLTPIQLARRIARIEAQMAEPPKPKVSNAPKAIRPLSATRPAQGELRDDMPIDEWARRFREQLATRY